VADATLHIKLEGDGGGVQRHNPDLDDFMAMGNTPRPRTAQPPPLPQQSAGPTLTPGARGSSWGVGPPPLPGGGSAPAAPGIMGQLAGQLGGSALAAAGPIGGVLMGIQQMTGSLQGMKKAVDGVSGALEGLASNQLPSATDGIDGAADFISSSLPIVGEMIGAQMKFQAAVLDIPNKLTAAFIEQAGRIQQYSGPISGAQAISDVRQIQADIREAQALGPGMGRMIDAQSRLDTTLREILLPIKKFIVEVLAERLELMANAVQVVSKLPELLQTIATELGGAVVLAITTEWKAAGQKIEDLPKKLADILKEKKDEDVIFDKFFQDAAASPLGGF
jgi:hypothetical protein